VFSYLRQVEICESIRKTIKQALLQSDDKNLKFKIVNIPTNESILRAVSISPDIDTEEKLKDFTIEHISSSLCLTPVQREHLNLNNG
jgi:hypothetical protein